MGVLLDTGAMIAFERGDRGVAAVVEAARRRHDRLATSSGCIAQAWRTGGPRQAILARLLAGVAERPLGPEMSRHVGEVCGRAKAHDVVDGHLALCAGDGDLVLTSDPDDIRRLLRACGTRADIAGC